MHDKAENFSQPSLAAPLDRTRHGQIWRRIGSVYCVRVRSPEPDCVRLYLADHDELTHETHNFVEQEVAHANRRSSSSNCTYAEVLEPGLAPCSQRSTDAADVPSAPATSRREAPAV